MEPAQSISPYLKGVAILQSDGRVVLQRGRPAAIENGFMASRLAWYDSFQALIEGGSSQFRNDARHHLEIAGSNDAELLAQIGQRDSSIRVLTSLCQVEGEPDCSNVLVNSIIAAYYIGEQDYRAAAARRLRSSRSVG